jgi:hypothetical protein
MWFEFEATTARWEVRLGTEVLTRGSSTWDYCGLNTSVELAVSDAKKYASQRAIGADSDLEVVAVKIVRRGRLQPAKDRAANWHDSTFVAFDRTPWERIGQDVETVVWSSRRPDEIRNLADSGEKPCQP